MNYNDLKSLKLPELKNLARQRGISVKQNKPQLIQQILSRSIIQSKDEVRRLRMTKNETQRQFKTWKVVDLRREAKEYGIVLGQAKTKPKIIEKILDFIFDEKTRFKNSRTEMKGVVEQYTDTSKVNQDFYDEYLRGLQQPLNDLLNRLAKEKKNIKFKISLTGKFVSQDNAGRVVEIRNAIGDMMDGEDRVFTELLGMDDEQFQMASHFEDEIIMAYFNTQFYTLNQYQSSTAEKMIVELINKIEGKEMGKSGLVWVGVNDLTLNVFPNNPRVGGKYVKLPEFIQSRKACINVKNDDDLCAIWSILAHLKPAKKHCQRTTKYQKEMNDLDLTGIDFPFHPSDAPILEKMFNISLTIFDFDVKSISEIYPIYISKNTDEKVFLGMYKSHYVLVKNANRLFHSLSKKEQKSFTCFRCMKNFNEQRTLDNHTETCSKFNNEGKIIMPKEGTTIRFKNTLPMLKNPFVVTADFEGLIKNLAKLIENAPLKVTRDLMKSINYFSKHDFDQMSRREMLELITSNTTYENIQSPFSVAMYLVSHDPQVKNKSFLYVGSDCVKKMYEKLEEWEQEIKTRFIVYSQSSIQQVVPAGDDIVTQDMKDDEKCYFCDHRLRDEIEIKERVEKQMNPRLSKMWNQLLNEVNKVFNDFKLLNEKEIYDEVSPKYHNLIPLIFYKRDSHNKFLFNNDVNLKLVDNILQEKLLRIMFHCHNKDYTIVRHHCHITEKFQGYAHNRCNLAARFTKHHKVPVYFHNLRGYDSHLILNEVYGSGLADEKFSGIVQNSEKLLQFSIGRYVFRDSMSHLPGSLDSLVANLKIKSKDPATGVITNHSDEELKEKFHHSFNHFTDEKYHPYITSKGSYCYSYINEHTIHEKTLPDYKEFMSDLQICDSLMTKDIREKLENKAKQVHKKESEMFEKLGMKDLREYHDFYLMRDVLLLADVFEAYREMSMKMYGLDASYYITAPSLAWDAMLKTTKCKLELISDIDKYMLWERQIRGGPSFIKTRFAETTETEKCLGWDANNLYGSMMMKFLPCGKFEWQKKENYQTYLNSTDERFSAIFDVDLGYPDEIHDIHDTFPLAPERLIPKDEWLSAKQKSLKYTKANEKIVLNLLDKERYVLHKEALQFYISKGLKVKKCHSVMTFKQSKCMKEYIEKNNKARNRAKTEFERNFFKLMNNSVYGKTIENVRNRVNATMCMNKKKFLKHANDLKCKDFTIFHDEFAIVMKHKNKIELTKPIYLGASILDFAKIHMYKFHYNYILPKYGHENVKLLFSDTDSCYYKIKTDKDIIEEMKSDKDLKVFGDDTPLFDLSKFNYDDFKDEMSVQEFKDNFHSHKDIVGAFKPECGNKYIKSFVGLKSKMYSYTLTNGKVCNKSKGTKRYVVNDYLRHENYLNVFKNSSSLKIDQRILQSKQHQIFQIKQTKLGLSAYDDKNYWLDDGMNTLSFGNYKLRK